MDCGRVRNGAWSLLSQPSVYRCELPPTAAGLPWDLEMASGMLTVARTDWVERLLCKPEDLGSIPDLGGKDRRISGTHW